MPLAFLPIFLENFPQTVLLRRPAAWVPSEADLPPPAPGAEWGGLSPPNLAPAPTSKTFQPGSCEPINLQWLLIMPTGADISAVAENIQN